MKADELRELSADDLNTRLEESREEFFNLRFQNATGQLENFAQIGKVKKDIARINTIVRERALGLEIEVKAPAQPKRSKAKKEEDEKKPRRSRKKVEDDD